MFSPKEENKYKIVVDNKTYFIVNERQLFRDKWIKFFGGIENVQEFIKNYRK